VLKRFEHDWILRYVGKQPQLELRVVCRDNLISFFCNERSSDASSQLSANGNVLQVGIARREPAGGSHRLIQQAMNSSVGRDLMWQCIGVNALEFVEFAVINNHSRQ